MILYILTNDRKWPHLGLTLGFYTGQGLPPKGARRTFNWIERGEGRAAQLARTVLAARLMASRGLDTWEELTVPILLSIINMNLRDKYASLTELCNAEDVSEEGIADKLKAAGYKYVAEFNQFKADT